MLGFKAYLGFGLLAFRIRGKIGLGPLDSGFRLESLRLESLECLGIELRVYPNTVNCKNPMPTLRPRP